MIEFTKQGNWKNLATDEDVFQMRCFDYVQKYLSLISVETPSRTVIKSSRIKRHTFAEQLAVIGGTLGLFTGMSILSMVEVVCFFLKLSRKQFCLMGQK